MSQKILCLSWHAPELRSLLYTGKLEQGGESWVVLPREVVRAEVGVETVIFEMIQTGRFARPSFLFAIFQAIRPESLAMTLLPCVSVLFYGYYQSWNLDRSTAFLAFLGVLFFQVSVNLLNDMEDHLRLIDLPGTLGGSGVIQRGWLSAKQLHWMGYFTLILGGICGLPAVFKNTPILLGVGVVGALGVLGYSNQPFGIKYRALGDLALFLLLGPLLSVGFSLAAFEKAGPAIFFVGVFFGLIAWAGSHASNLPDIEVDSRFGIYTLASSAGFKLSRHILNGLYILAYLTLVLGTFLKILPSSVLIVSIAGIPAIGHLLSQVYRAAGPASARLGMIRFDAAKVQILLGALICFGLLAASLWSSTPV